VSERTRLYVDGEDLTKLRADQGLAGCGTCGRTLVVTETPGLMREFWYCSDRENCGTFKKARAAKGE
jgi:ssDNA-binding Zn-finger/Zn-ribbon topoisomerase 1